MKCPNPLPLILGLALLGGALQARAQCPTRATKTWLDSNERAGGHVKACHVNKSDNGLIGRITSRGGQQGPNCRQGNSASSFTDVSAAVNAIDSVLKEHEDAIRQWWDGGAGANLALDGTASGSIGRVVTQYSGKPGKNRSSCPRNSSFVCKDSSSYKVVLASRNQACIVLTAYPQ